MTRDEGFGNGPGVVDVGDGDDDVLPAPSFFPHPSASPPSCCCFCCRSAVVQARDNGERRVNFRDEIGGCGERRGEIEIHPEESRSQSQSSAGLVVDSTVTMWWSASVIVSRLVKDIWEKVANSNSEAGSSHHGFVVAVCAVSAVAMLKNKSRPWSPPSTPAAAPRFRPLRWAALERTPFQGGNRPRTGHYAFCEAWAPLSSHPHTWAR
jgi:hypothetical protein